MWDNPWAMISAFVALIAMLSNLAAILVGLKLRNAMLELRQQLSDQLTLAVRDVYQEIEQQGLRFGEVAAALRSKIHEVEVWSRDNFIRREGFYAVRDDLRTEIRAVGHDIKELDREARERLASIEQKVANNHD